MNLSNIKRLLNNEVSLSNTIPITHLVAPNIFETQDGYLGAVLKIKGVPYLIAEADELNQYQRTVHHAILQLSDQFMVMETVHRRYEKTSLTGNFTIKFCESLHKNYHKRFEGGAYVNDIYLTVLYKGDASRLQKKGSINRLIAAFSNLSDKTVVNGRELIRAKRIKTLNQTMNQWVASLAAFKVTRLGDNTEGASELLAYLSLVPDGGQPTFLHNQTYFPARAKTPDAMNLVSPRYPHGHVGQYLANHRLFFGDAIQFQGNGQTDARFAAMLSIKTYHNETTSQSLDALLALDCEFIRTQTYAPMEEGDALSAITAAYNKKVSADDFAFSQIEELALLVDDVASGKVSIGGHHNTLMLLCSSKEALEIAVNDATHAYAKKNLVVVRETLAQALSFFAQIPGNGRFITRPAPITSENFADFCTFHNIQHGYKEGCLLGEPITIVQTAQKTPVFFNYHKPGSMHSPSSGHSLIIGGNGSGKTAVACFLDAEMNRFAHHRTFFLDRNEGAKIYILACDGTYITISPSHRAHCQMNPLQLPDTEENRAFCKNWMEALLLEGKEEGLESSLTALINDVINYGFDHLAPADRQLSTVAALLPIDFPRWPQLRRWLKESESREAGQFSWAFDNTSDDLNLNAIKTGIDLTYLMDYVPTEIPAPVYMYILHRIKLW